MKFQSLKKIQKMALGFALVLASASVVHAGGSHAGAAPQNLNPFSKTQSVADDATNFHVISLEKTSIPTSMKVVVSDCWPTPDNPYAKCSQVVYGNYVPAYRVNVGYTSQETNLASNEYPNTYPKWNASFNFQNSEISPALIASLPSDSRSRKEVLNQIFQITKSVETYPTRYSDPRNCKWVEDDNTSSDAVAGHYEPAGCENNTLPGTAHKTEIQISVNQ